MFCPRTVTVFFASFSSVIGLISPGWPRGLRRQRQSHSWEVRSWLGCCIRPIAADYRLARPDRTFNEEIHHRKRDPLTRGRLRAGRIAGTAEVAAWLARVATHQPT